MAGTVEGGRQAAITNKLRYGDDFYKKLGHKSGSVSRPASRPFSQNRELAREAGRKGAMARLASLKRKKEAQNDE